MNGQKKDARWNGEYGENRLNKNNIKKKFEICHDMVKVC